MDSPDKPKDLVNYDKTWRMVICINPGHETVRFDTNQTGTIKCPLCESPMVVEVATRLTAHELD